jgi:hypothetical protein
VSVRAGESFRLRFAVLIYSMTSETEPDRAALYKALVRKLADLPRPQP